MHRLHARHGSLAVTCTCPSAAFWGSSSHYIAATSISITKSGVVGILHHRQTNMIAAQHRLRSRLLTSRGICGLIMSPV